MFKLSGRWFITGLLGRILSRLYRDIKSFLRPRLIIRNPYGKDMLFLFNSFITFNRVVSIFAKEEGTINWIKNNLDNNDVFYDIGANIGIYSLFGLSISDSTEVYSFEPHAVNAGLLIENILRNNVANRAKVITAALNDENSFEFFDYKLIEPGSSFSQFRKKGESQLGDEYLFSEIKYGCTIDYLIDKGIIKEPSLIKIDVDGNELKVLEGMKNLLQRKNNLKSIQLEMNVGEYEKIEEFMKNVNFVQTNYHYGSSGKKLFDKGITREKIPHHVIYEPVK
tara:strand:- start:181 stop:1023 length:843 start_codon:yes stop_codon:yes gene_type:complete